MCLIVQFNGRLFNVIVLITYPKFHFHRLFMMKLIMSTFILTIIRWPFYMWSDVWRP